MQHLPYRALKEEVWRSHDRAVRHVHNCQDDGKCLMSESERPMKREKGAGGVRDHDEGSKTGGGSVVICEMVSAWAR
jgi:hypothetical protein